MGGEPRLPCTARVVAGLSKRAICTRRARTPAVHHRLLFFIIGLLLSTRAYAASDLKVSSPSIHLDETISIIVTLEGDYGDVNGVNIPLANLAIEGSPSVSSQFQWFNGVSSSRKVFRYTAHALAVGRATVGPLQLIDANGHRETLPQIVIEVLPEIAGGNNDPREQLREYASSGRERVAFAAEVSNPSPYVGQQVVVTWCLYTMESVISAHMNFAPRLSDFWTEELPVMESEQSDITVDGQPAKKVVIRRVALFPLRSGPLEIGAAGIDADVLQPVEDSFGGISMNNSREVDVRRRSAPLHLNVQTVPNGISQVGHYEMSCTPPVASANGPISFDVTLRGDGNMRAATPPRLSAAIAGSVDAQALGAGVELSKNIMAVGFTRKWRVLVYPNRSGRLHVPPVAFDTFNPDAGVPMTLTCGGGDVAVQVVRKAAPAEPAAGGKRRIAPWKIAAAAAVVLAVAALVPFALLMRRRRRVRRALVAAAETILTTPFDAREVRRRLYDFVERHGARHEQLVHEASERGERFRAVMSLIDLRRTTSDADAAEIDAELRERVIELVAAL